MALGLFAVIFTACDEDDPDPVDTTPTITSVTPNSAPAGDTITIAGTNFGTSPTLTIGGTSATVISATASSIEAEVPESLGLGAAEIIVTAGGETANANFEVIAAPLPSLVEIAQAVPDLSSLVAALAEAGLVDAVSVDGPLTVFAPDNDAFAALLTVLGAGGVGDVPDDLLEITLLDHVVVGSVFAADLSDGDTIEALSGRELVVSVDGSTVTVGGATVTTADNEASNGVAHIVDAVLMPINPATELALHLIENNNAIADLGLEAANVVPAADAVITENLAAYPANDFFTDVSYKGAFEPGNDSWLDGWSLLSRGGYLGGTAANQYAFDPADTVGAGSVLVNLPQTIDGDRLLDADSIYKFEGYTFVENGELEIEAGTVLIAETEPTTGDPISAIIITRSATINANGTAEAPIIFTSENDTESGVLDEFSTGEWGGLVILGEGIASDDGATEIQIEGIPTTIPALYGGPAGQGNNEDNSGTLRYVSIRYTGDAIAAGNELQGLTLGAVGSGTTIEYVESFASSDDGVEIFGGAPELKYFAVGFAEDDSYDFDIGYVGNIQFGFAVQGGNDSDNFIEWDGAVPDNSDVYSNPSLYNMTFLGNAQSDQAVLMRDNTGGTLANSVIINEGTKGIQVEDLDGDADSYNRLVNTGEITIAGNVFDLGDDITLLTTGTAGAIQPTE